MRIYGIQNKQTKAVVWSCALRHIAFAEWCKRCEKDEFYKIYYKLVVIRG